jgi:hypothetical protein
MIDKNIVKLCVKDIDQLGGIDDLPYELQNTIANLYYDYYLLNDRFANTEKGIPKVFKKEGDALENLRNLTMDSLFLTHHVPKIPEYVRSLCRTKREDPEIYDYMVELYTDMLKYKIKNTFKKNGIRRSIERRRNKKKVSEYPDLIGTIKIHIAT